MEGECDEKLLLVVSDGITDNANGYVDGNLTFVLVLSVFVAVCGSFSCGCAGGYSSPVQSSIIADLGLSTAEYSLFGSMLTIGGLLGSLVSGKVTDFIGRRGAMGFSDVLFLAGWLAIAFSQNAWSLDFGRFALGFANGIIAYAVPVYIAEITPKNLRGGLVLLYQLMSCCGIALVFLAGLVTSWRILGLIGTVPCIIQLFGLFFIPDSPRWLVKVSHDKSYETTLQRLRGKNFNISHEIADIKLFTEAVKNMPKNNFFNVLQMKYAYALIVSLGLMALTGFGGAYGILFYATAIFESSGFSGSIGTIAMALIQLPPTTLGVLLMDNFGRKPLLLCSAAGMSISCLSLALSFFFKEHGWMTNFSPYLALAGILLYAATYPVGMGGIPFVIMSEIFPINIKGEAGSLAIVVYFSSSWVVSYSFNFIMEWSSSGTFVVYAIINILSLLFVVKIVPETKGKTLEEIQESLTRIFY